MDTKVIDMATSRTGRKVSTHGKKDLGRKDAAWAVQRGCGGEMAPAGRGGGRGKSGTTLNCSSSEGQDSSVSSG